MSKILSGKIKKIPSTAVSADRYNFLQLSEAEPDLGVPVADGYILTSDTIGNRSWANLGTPNNGALTLGIGDAAATNTTVTIGTGTGFTANSANPATYDIKVGPALTALATLMTNAGTGFIKRGDTADTYTIDTSTYLTANQNISITGDATGSGTTAITLTLAASGVSAGTYNLVNVNSKGLITSGSNVSYLTANQTISVTGDATGSGTTAIALTLAATGVSAGTYNVVNVNNKGLVTAGSNVDYLTSYTETDTLQTVTGRGTSSNAATITLSAVTVSSNTGTGTLVVGGGVGIGGAVNIGGAAVVGGNLTVNGTLVANIDWADVLNKPNFSAKATSTTLGLVELASDIIQTVDANAITSTANKTYGVQLNAADQLVVNVPWPDTLPNTSALTIGTGLSGTAYTGAEAVTIALENTTVTPGNYTNVSITVDAQGRITAAENGAASGNRAVVLSMIFS